MNVSETMTPKGKSGGADLATLALLERIDQRLARVEAFVGRASELEAKLPATLAAATDTVDSLVDRMRESGVDVDERLQILVDVAERLTSPEALRALTALLDKLDLIQHLLDSGIFAEPSVDVVAKAGQALAAAGTESPPEVGLWGAARAAGNEDVKRALGFLIRVAQLFGRSLGEPSSGRLLTGGKV